MTNGTTTASNLSRALLSNLRRMSLAGKDTVPELTKDENRRRLVRMTNFFEELSLLVNQGRVDEDFLKLYFGSLVATSRSIPK